MTDTATVSPRFMLILIVAALCTVLFSHMNVVELRGEEPRRAVVAMEMDLTGEYIVPRINGWNYYNKPPLFNWLLVICFKIFGSYDTWVVRIPALISFLLTGLAQYFFVRKYWTREIAILSTLFFLTAGDLLFYGTQLSGEIDLFFTFLVCLQIMALYHFFRQERYLTMFLVSYGFAAMGVLTKGPPALAFQGITLLVMLWYFKKLKWLIHWKHIAGIALFLGITGSYFMAYAQKADVLPYIINLCKEASQKSGLENQSWRLLTSSLSYPLMLVQWMLPWSLLTVFLWSKKTIREIRTHDFLAFIALFVLANIPLYALTTQPKSRYVYMFFPFISVLLAYAWKARKTEWSKAGRLIRLLFSVVIIALPVAALVMPWIQLKVPVDHAFLKGMLVFLLSSLPVWICFRWKGQQVYAMILSLILIRLLLNFFYLPSLREGTNAMVNKRHMEHILSITGDQPLALSGKPYTQANHLTIGKAQLLFSEITTAPLLSYMIPYYYTRARGAILEYQPGMQPGHFYLIYEADLATTPVDTLYRFEEPWTREAMALVRLK